MPDILTRYSSGIESALECSLPPSEEPYADVIEAMRYSLLAGGKRIRPALVLEFCRICGGNPESAMPFACAVEMIHTYSLIHDDLPCMDDDDLRRGRPSCHRRFGEAVALIAADALQAEAFRCLTSADLPPERIVTAVRILAELSGKSGMVGGQMMDISSENSTLSDGELLQMYDLKTSCLLSAACQLGCIAAGRFDFCSAASEFARNLGLAFQIQDDILDETGDIATLGKDTGNDAKNGKATYVARYGVTHAKEIVSKYSAAAKSALDVFNGKQADLLQLTDLLMQRDR